MIEPFVKQDHLKKAIDPLTLAPAIYLKADTLNLNHESDVLKWHDLSGNDRHFIGATGTAPMIFNGFNNGLASIHFDGTTRLAYPFVGASNNYIVSMLVRPEEVNLLAMCSAGNQWFALHNSVPVYNQNATYLPAPLSTEVVDKWIVMTLRVVGTNAKIYIGRNQVLSGTVPIGVLSINHIGWLTSAFGWRGKIQEAFIKDGTLTDAQLSDLIVYYCNEAGIVDVVPAILSGDSLTKGTYPGSIVLGYPQQLTIRRKDFRIYNDGVDGSQISHCVTRATLINNNALRLTGSSVYVAWAGTNNIGNYQTASATIAAYAAWCTTQRAAGYKVIACTIINRTEAYAGLQAAILAFNVSIRANYATYADGLCDLALDSRLSDCTNTIYFDVDQIHLIDAGLAIVADLVETAIDALDLLPDLIRLADVTATTDGVPSAIQDAIDAGGGSVATDIIWDVAGDLAVGTGANTAARLAIGTALQTLRVNAGATALEWATTSVTTIVGITGTKAQFDTAVTDGNFAYQSDLATYQPLDSDLTAIAALATTSSGRSLLTVAGTTGTGNSVLSASPTLTGTTLVAAMTASGAVTITNGANEPLTVSEGATGGPAITCTGSATLIRLLRTGLVDIGLGTSGGDSFRISNVGDATAMLSIHQATKLATFPGAVIIGGGTSIAKGLSATATLNFASILAGGFEDLTITVTGATVGSTVVANPPTASVTDNITYDAWVSAADTVTVRASNNNLITARDPASGTFRATVFNF